MTNILREVIPLKARATFWKVSTKVNNFLFGSQIYLYKKYYSLFFKPLIIREGTTDRYTFRQIFISREFGFPIDIEPKLIIDAGANVGYASLYFSLRFPNAKIIAIEPEESNFKVLKKHTQKNKNIKIIKAGLWNKNANLIILDKLAKKSSFTLRETGPAEEYDVKAITINSILKKYNYDKIDILKIDIEGSEKELFSKNYESWLGKVNILVIELRERMKKGCEKNFWAAVNKYDFEKIGRGERIILFKK